MATTVRVVDYLTIDAASTPSGADEWQPVGNYSYMNVRYKVSTPAGTDPGLVCYVEFTDDNQATSGTKALASEIDFFDKADEVIVPGIPVGGAYARVNRTLAGSGSPSYILSVTATLW
tara:strand:- start:175 stop:528 length:354 start_codon:yes stop_codon:yes gene_type:complete